MSSGAGSHAAGGAFVTIGRDMMAETWQDEMKYTANIMFAKDNGVTLFRAEDWKAWVTFTIVFTFLIIFDNVIMNRNPQALTIGRACIYALFWILMAGCFCGWVYWYYDEAHAFMWMSGYMLEWMLSFDNLFVFHMIFDVYKCPDDQKHKALYLGIIGAVFFRVVFLFAGEYLMHKLFFMHLVFGAFLIYTGVKTMMVDDEDDDPSQHPAILWLQERFPFVSVYDKNMAFFVKLPVDEQDKPLMPELIGRPAGDGGESAPLNGKGAAKDKYGTVDFDVLNAKLVQLREARTKTFATMLFLVVCCLEFSDILFAVDSVSAIVAQVPDLFLAYTSAVFAMLGLRATFFIIDVLVKLFTLLKYGVGFVLVFVGIKLCIGHWYHVPPGIVCAVLFLSIGGSMVASVLKEKYCPDPDSDDDDDKSSARASPAGSRNGSRMASPAIPQRQARVQ
jgi:tellurite resistance protein TerC